MKTLLASTLAVLALFASATNSNAIPVTWSGNGHTYEVIAFSNQTWNTARANAQTLGAGWDLATITSAGEQSFINGLLGTPPSGGIVQYWVGGFQPTGSPEPGGNWQWINGEGQFWNNGAIPGAYSNWGTIEPNDVGGQNHVALDNRYGWGWDDNDSFVAGVINGYVAERAGGSTAIPEPSSFFLAACGLLGVAWYAWRQRRQAGLQIE